MSTSHDEYDIVDDKSSNKSIDSAFKVTEGTEADHEKGIEP